MGSSNFFIRKAAVLGTGIMGPRIAAHLRELRRQSEVGVIMVTGRDDQLDRAGLARAHHGP